MNYLVEVANRVRSAVPPSLVPDGADDLFLLYAVLARSRGSQTTAEEVHDAWTAWKLIRGEDHESMVPFRELPPSVRSEDAPFLAAIRQVATRASSDDKAKPT